MSKDLTTSVRDKESGEVISITPEMQTKLNTLEFGIISNWVQTAISLKTIKDEKLYLVRSDSWGEYVREYLHESLGFSERQVSRHLQIASTYSEKVLQKASKGTPMQSLIDISRDPQLVEQFNEGEVEIDGDRVVYADGTFDSLSAVRERVRKETAKKYQKQLEAKEIQAKGQDAMLSDYRERLQSMHDEQEQLRSTIKKLVSDKGIDPKTIVFVTQKREAISLIEQHGAKIIELLGDLSNIPQELLDADVTARLTSTIAMMQAGTVRLKEHYGSTVWVPSMTDMPTDDVVPE